MATSTSYVVWTYSQYVRLEIIQVDNGASHVNVSCNLQVHSSFSGANGAVGTKSSFDGQPFNGTLTAGATTIDFNGTNGTYTGTGWYSVATKWIGTIPRSAGTFSINWYTYWRDTDKTLNVAHIPSGNVTIMPYVQPDGKDSLSNYSTATIGSSVTFTVTNTTAYAHTDTLSYSIGNASGNISSSFSVPANSTKTVSWTPAASLGAQIPNTFTGTVTLTLTTSGQGSNTYTCQLTVPTYTYTMNSVSVSKVNYQAIGGTNYIAQKHTARWSFPSFPTAMYGATLTGEFYAISGSTILYQTSATSGGTADYTHTVAGTVTGTLRVTDSRGVMVQKTAGTTWVANPSVSVTFTAKRSGSSTTVNLVASGTYSSTITGLGATLEISANGTPVQSASGAGGTASITTTDTLALANSMLYICTITDTLGNSATKRVTVTAAFFYIQVGGGSGGKGVAIGRAASTSGTDTLEVGLPTTIDGDTRVSMFREYKTVDVDQQALSSIRDVLVPRVTTAIVGATASGTDAGRSAAFEKYMIWLAKNYKFDMIRCRGLFQNQGMFVIDAYLYSTVVNADGLPQYSMGLAYTYGGNTLYRFGTSNYNWGCCKASLTAI